MLEWSEFARRLGRELAGLDRDTILIVRERDESRHYVQAMREPDRLYAEAVSNNFLEGPLLLTLADEEVMSEAGWRPPSDPAPRNWWTELPEFGTPGGMRSVTEGDFARLADVMVTALRDVQGVRRPSDLVYESFHRHGTGLIELTDFGIDVADPARVQTRRASSGFQAADPLAGAAPPTTGTPKAGDPAQGQGDARMDADQLESRLAEAKANGDNVTYFRLLENADLVLPATAPAVEDPDRAEFPTIAIGAITHITVFTSPAALARTGDRHPGLYRRTSFAQLAAGWPDPTWRLAINWGLPSEVLLDSSVISRLSGDPGGIQPHPGSAQSVPGVAPTGGPDLSNPYGTVDPTALSGPNPIAGDALPTRALNGSTSALNGSSARSDEPVGLRDDSHTVVDPYTPADLRTVLQGDPGAEEQQRPEPAEPREPEPRVVEPVASEPEPAPLGAPTNNRTAANAEQPAASVPLRLPHGTRLWKATVEGDETPVAVYDAIGGAWAPVTTDNTVPAPRTE